MTEEPLFGLAGSLQPKWSDKRAAVVRAAIERRVRRQRATRWVLATSFLMAGCLALVLFVRGKPHHGLPAGVSPAARAPLAAPTATPLTADTELVVDPQGAGRAFLLRRGSARFVVTHDQQRPFRVRSGPLVVEDLGTVFTVARLSEHEFDVAVDEGLVAVLCESNRVELRGGERQMFACGAPEKRAAAAPPSPAAPSRSQRQPAPRWKVLAEQGQYREAFDSLRGESQTSVRDEIQELLLAADTARLSGHPAEAVPYLRRVLARHGEDSRSHLAAFTLGRVLLDELGRPAEAAVAFERARAPHAPLAEDALARSVEAWARAGDARRAHALALDYQRDYPQGRRMRTVAKFGGIK